MSEWPRKTRKRAYLELGLLRREIDEHRQLLGCAASGEPGRMEAFALAAVLHSFYNGVENIFKRIALEIDGSLPVGRHSHADLLVRMAEPYGNRRAAISAELRERLGDFMEFRHVFRHAYSFDLDWGKLSKLAQRAEETLRLLEADLAAFFGPEDEEEAKG